MCMVTYLRIESSLVETRAHLQNEVTYLADVLEVQIFNGSSDFVSLSSLRLPNLPPFFFSSTCVCLLHDTDCSGQFFYSAGRTVRSGPADPWRFLVPVPLSATACTQAYTPSSRPAMPRASDGRVCCVPACVPTARRRAGLQVAVVVAFCRLHRSCGVVSLVQTLTCSCASAYLRMAGTTKVVHKFTFSQQ